MATTILTCQFYDKPPEKGKKRNRPGNPDPEAEAEVVALSPNSLTATHRFFCEIRNKVFTRDQNLQLHKRGHNLPWKLKQGSIGDKMKRKKRYVCPEPTCIYHNPSRALGDITGIKKHFLRKHYDGEKKWKCKKCAKLYAVESDFKAHSKTCGTKEHPCDNGIIFSRTEGFLTHGIHGDSVAEKHTELFVPENPTYSTQPNLHFNPPPPSVFPYPSSHYHFNNTYDSLSQTPNPGPQIPMVNYVNPHVDNSMMWSLFGNSQYTPTSTLPPLSSTELLQKGAMVGTVGLTSSTMSHIDMHATADPFTRDFIGMADQCSSRNVDRGEGSGSVDVLSYIGESNYNPSDCGHSFSNHQVFEYQNKPDTWRNW